MRTKIGAVPRNGVTFFSPPAAWRRSVFAVWILLFWIVISFCDSLPTAARGAEQNEADWFGAFVAARETILRHDRATNQVAEPNFTSEIIRGGEPAVLISVPIEGASELFLYVTGAPDVIYGAATWADAKLIADDGSETRICHLKGLEIQDGRHDIDQNLESGVSGPLQIAGRRFDHGIHVYARSKIRLPVPPNQVRLEAWIGIDDWVGSHGAVQFRVTGRGGAARIDLWETLAEQFSEAVPRQEMKWEREDQILEADWEPGDYRSLAKRYAAACKSIPALAELSSQKSTAVTDRQSLEQVRTLYHRARSLDHAVSRAGGLNYRGLRLAIEDLMQTRPADYDQGAEYLERLVSLEQSLARELPVAQNRDVESCERVATLVGQFEQLQREALLANPFLDFDQLLLIRRVPHGDPRRPQGTGYGVGEYIGLPRQSSKCNPNIDQPFAWKNEIAILSPVRPQGQLSTVYQSTDGRLITDIDLHWDADQLLFSMPGSHNQWHVFQMRPDGSELRQLTPTNQPDVHFYDSCYLPNGQIAFVSTAPFQGVPCNAGVIVGMMYLMDGDGSNIRQVCFEQDHSYCPTVLNDGRIMYLRWDYTDTPHVWNRILFSMNPDGTSQMEYYGSNSYWPNSIFYARPLPDHPTKFVGIVTGHHVGRVGELLLFDTAQGRFETDGVVQRIPGRGQKVEPLIEDKLTEHSWPKFVHPYPLSEKHFLVSCKPTPDSLWGIYLVDVFDNMVLIKEQERHVLLEPIPLRKSKTPPVIPNQVDLTRDDALVYLQDVYAGPGLSGVPRGSVKQLRVFTYHFGYQKLAGIDHRIGSDGPWEVKRVLGTVPVEEDGSALFRVPAKTPLSIQPLDEEGKALQLMRSWMTAMPGEVLSCVGCHERADSAVLPVNTLALAKDPAEIQPWYGTPRGFSFKREVQPVLDRYCVGCHDGSKRDDGQEIPNLRGDQDAYYVYRHGDPELKFVENEPVEQLMKDYKGIFPPSYLALRRLVRVGGLESDLHLLPPKEFHADTTELIQLLRKGHHNVQLDREAWDRLLTWIDLNAPCHGTWSEFTRISGDQRSRRVELRQLYGGLVEDAEQLPILNPPPVQPVMPPLLEQVNRDAPTCDGWPFDQVEAIQRQKADGRSTWTIDLGNRVSLDLVRIPAGRFVMGDPNGASDEQPCSVVSIDKPFWMGRFEVTNRQYAQFDPTHDSRFEHRTSWIFSEDYLGWPLNRPEQPVVRVAWNEAIDFCEWLSQRIGVEVTLPTEAEWEYACRAGTDTPLWFGDLDADFSQTANVADATIRDLAYEGWRPRPPDIVPRDARYDDDHLVTAPVGSYRPNPWGLHDMHGNAAEWMLSDYRAYPYAANDGRNGGSEQSRKVVRGGSWYDRPHRCRSAFRLDYDPWQKIYNVGFRVVVRDPAVVTSE